MLEMQNGRNIVIQSLERKNHLIGCLKLLKGLLMPVRLLIHGADCLVSPVDDLCGFLRGKRNQSRLRLRIRQKGNQSVRPVQRIFIGIGIAVRRQFPDSLQLGHCILELYFIFR